MIDPETFSFVIWSSLIIGILIGFITYFIFNEDPRVKVGMDAFAFVLFSFSLIAFWESPSMATPLTSAEIQNNIEMVINSFIPYAAGDVAGTVGFGIFSKVLEMF